jgi:PAS domain S-box-containing protein
MPVLLWRARQVTSAARRGLLGAAFCFACYTLSSGLVSRVAEFLPIESLHDQSFLNALGFPVHLFWIGTAVGTSVGLWVYNIHSTSRNQDLRVSSLRRRFGGYVAGVLCVIAVVGWSGTERLGLWGLNQDLAHGKSAAAYTEAIFMRAVTTARGLAISLSQSPEIRGIFAGPIPQVSEDSRAALDRRSIVVPGAVCYVLNLEGMVLDATNRGTPESWVGETFASRRYFQEALLGHPSEYLAMGLLTHLPAFFASHPIFDPDGRVVGVVVIRSLLSTLNLFPEDGPAVLFVDSHGVVMESPQQRYNSRALWPLTPEAQQAALDSGQHRTIDFTPFLEREVEDREVCVVEGRLKAVVRRLLPTQGYSLLVLCNLSHLPLFRLIAISMTLLASVGTLAFAFGRQKDIESLWALEASQRRYRGLVESSQNLIFLFDASGRCLAANSVARSMLDVSEETLLSRYFLDLMWPDSVRPEVEKALAQVLEGHLVRFDAQAIPCGDTAKDLLVALSPILDFQGAVERFVCIGTDITEQKRIERALRDSEERFRQIALNMGDWVFELDENQVYTYCSPRIYDILGYTPEELIGKRILDHQNPEEVHRLRAALVEPVWVKQQSLFDTEFTLHHKNGSARNLLVSLSPYFSESGKFLGVRGWLKILQPIARPRRNAARWKPASSSRKNSTA